MINKVTWYQTETFESPAVLGTEKTAIGKRQSLILQFAFYEISRRKLIEAICIKTTQIEQRCRGTFGSWLAIIIPLCGWEDQTGGSVWLLLRLLVNSPAHSPVAVYCGGKPCKPRPKNTNSTAGPFFFFFSLRFIFSIEKHTQNTAPSLFLQTTPPPSRYLTGIRLDFWRGAAANKNSLCQIGRIPWSEKGLILWWVPPAESGGVRPRRSPGQL